MFKIGLSILLETNIFIIIIIILNYCIILTVCARSDLGRELAQSDSSLTHAYSIAIAYNSRMMWF